MIFRQCCPALLSWPTHAQVLPWSFRPAILTRLPDHSLDGLAVASSIDPSLALSEHGPASSGAPSPSMTPPFAIKIAIHGGPAVVARFGCVALLEIGSTQTCIRRDVLDRMLSVGAASIVCEKEMHPSFLWRLWRIDPSETFDECTPGRPLFSRG